MLLFLIILTCSCVTHGVLGHDEIPTVYIERGSASDSVPCVGLELPEKINLLYWYKGGTLDDALENLLVRYADTNVGVNFTVSDRYSLTPGYGLKIDGVEPADGGSYWCRVVRQVTGRQTNEQVDLVVIVVPQKPTISRCDSSESSPCEVEASTRLVLDCTVSNAYPSLDITWSFIGCEENEYSPGRWFVSNQSQYYDPESETYNVTVAISLGEIRPRDDDVCSFKCAALGDATLEEQLSSILRVSGKAETWANNSPSNVGLVVVIVILVILLLLTFGFVGYFVRNRRRNYQSVETDAVALEDEVHETKPIVDTEIHKDINGDNNVLKYLTSISIPELQGSVVTGVVALANGGILVATKSRLHSLSPEEFRQFSFTDFALLGKEDSPHIISPDTTLLEREDSPPASYPSATLTEKEDPPTSSPETTRLEKGSNTPTSSSPKTTVLEKEGPKLTAKKEAPPCSITSIAKCSANETAVVGLESGLRFMRVNVGIAVDDKVSHTELKNPVIAIDDIGVIFAGESKTRIIYRIEDSNSSTGSKLDKHKIETTLANIAACGRRIIFVNNGNNELHKCEVHYKTPLRNISHDEKFLKTVPEGSTHGRMAVSGGALYICSTTKGCRDILQYDAKTGKLVQTYKTEMSDLLGLCLFGGSKVALYGGNWVKIYERKDRDQSEKGDQGQADMSV